MEVIEYNNSYKKKWNAYVESQQNSSISHYIEWKDIITETFQIKSNYLIAVNENQEIEGILPLFLMRNIFGKKFLISNPIANYSGICTNSGEVTQLFISYLKIKCTTLNVEYLELRQLNQIINDLHQKDSFVNYYLDLNGNEDSVWKNKLTPTVRNQVRKADKFQLVFCENETIDVFYAVYSHNMRDLGSPPIPKIYFQKIKEKLGEKVNVLSVYHNNKPICVMFVIKEKNFFSIPWASSLRKFNFMCPNNFIYWHAIKKAINEGYKIFDMGRSTKSTGTSHFKKQWGAIPIPLNYSYILNNAKEIPLDDASNNKYDFAIKIWKKLPIIVSNLVGPKLIKYLPEI